MVSLPVSRNGSGRRVLAVVDGKPELGNAAIAAADIFASTPRAEFTLLAPSEVASPAAPSSNGLVQLSHKTSSLMQTVRKVEDCGFPTRLQTTEGPLLQEALRIADGHDVVVLPQHLADKAGSFPVPVLII